MCGILGEIRFEKILPSRKKTFSKALERLRSRGPNAGGIYTGKNCLLGHRRLSILDVDSRSNQPMIFGDLVITFNGEIYNFKELKKELTEKGYKFKTTSDTEVILYAYKEWGEDCVKKFDGMWAFCIHNIKKNTYFLSRDRIGEKPLVYFKGKNKFLFSSEIPALLELLNKDEIKPNWQALANFNTYNFRHIPAPYSAFKDIYKLEPGYNLTIQDGKVSKKKYFKITKQEIERIEETTRETIKKATEQTMISDVPVGVFLSGGVDSSLISSFMDKNITTYTLGYDKRDPEAVRARKIANKLGVKNKQVYFKNSPEKANLLDEIRKTIRAYGEPIHLYQIIYSNMLLEEMKKDGIKVAVGGNGADELFYGYDGANKLKLVSKIKTIWNKLRLRYIIPNIHPVIRLLNKPNSQAKIELYREALRKKSFVKEEYKDFMYEKQIIEYSKEIHSDKLIDIFNWLGLRIENEHSITNVADISGSINSMEIRTIFLNRIVMDLAMSLPEEYKVTSYCRKKNNKYILKKILSSILGKELTYDKKRGFGYGFDMGELFEDNSREIKRLFKNILPKIKLYNEEKIQKLYKEDVVTAENQDILMEVILTCIWYEEMKVIK